MKKVGIITITGLGNYGNRLQNYALQKAIEKTSECHCETLINKSCRIKGYIKRILIPSSEVLSERERIFEKFNKEFIHFSDIRINNFSKDHRLLECDCLICGSDQIWNSDYPENDRANFGYFFPNIKVVSYAASFGTDTIAEKKKRRYAKYLKRMDAISVREEKGKELAEYLTGRDDICVHIDPTLLLTAEEWLPLEKKPVLYKGERYILKYFLGEKNKEINRELEEYAKKHNLTIIDVISKDSPYYNIGPSEFLFLERNADFIVTDSFHSCVFAIIYKRPFIVVERKENGLQSMGSRIDTLLNKFHLENRRYTGSDLSNIAQSSIDYSYVNVILEFERNESVQYLKKYLSD
jgi:polysaccharide pyruvyl transferase WcaK-like protein